MKDKPFVYLAGPYSHPSSDIRARRARCLTQVAAYLFKTGVCIFSPITNSHAMKMVDPLLESEFQWNFWEKYDRVYLERSHMLIVLCLHGWKESVGTTAEIRIAKEHNIPIQYMNPNTMDMSDTCE